MAADYKANRAPMPDELAVQIPLVHDACEALGVPILTHQRYEADDVIGTLAERASGEGFDVAIVTGDKDFFQLVRDGIRVFNPRDDGTWYDGDGVKEKFGVAPGPGRGRARADGRQHRQRERACRVSARKGARDLITTYGLARRAARAGGGDSAEALSRGAARARRRGAQQPRASCGFTRTCPVEFTVEQFRYPGADQQACFQIFSDLGFRSLMMEFAPTAATVRRTIGSSPTPPASPALVAELRAARPLSRCA